MVASSVTDQGPRRTEPDIFVAAATDDVAQMALCLQRGAKLDDIDEDTSLTPIHVAIIEGSDNFLRAAMAYDFNPWIKDRNDRLPIDHASAAGLTDVQRRLHQKMYPGGWAAQPALSMP